MDRGGVRWKSRDAAAIADADPMSKIIYQLQSSLEQSQTCGLLSGSAVLIQAGSDLTKLLNRACFGRPIITAPPTSSCSLKGMKYKLGEQQSTDLQWFQLGMEEAFYLSYSLNCLSICCSTREGRQNLNPEEIWRHMKEKQKMFLQHYKAYSHLRAKNWVVRSGLQYGADFVAYRHHPALVHSEHAVIISSESDVRQARLTTWSDWQSTLRLSGSVAKITSVSSLVGTAKGALSLLRGPLSLHIVSAHYKCGQHRGESEGSLAGESTVIVGNLAVLKKKTPPSLRMN